MSEKSPLKPLAVAMGAAFVTSLAGTGVANAADNPFALSELTSGYLVAEGDNMGGEGGSMKSGEEMKTKEGNCGATKASGEAMKAEEGKCGEGKCGEKRKAHEGKCGGAVNSGEEMKPGEGKCGGMK